MGGITCITCIFGTMGGHFFIFGPVLHVFVVHFALTTSCLTEEQQIPMS